jgi:hypothetical protein
MNAVLLEQTASQLARQTVRWDRRLRLAGSLVWVPRGLMVGLFVGIGVAVISRLRPWLLPEQIALIAAVALGCSAAGALALIWLWPRSKTYRARYFDHRFELKERLSTALELTGGLIPFSDQLAERQLSDAVNTARGVNLTAHLPLRVFWREILAVIALALLLVYLLVADNPLNNKLRAQRDLKNAIDSQIAELDSAIKRIEQNPALSAEEKEALAQPLEQARDILQQPGVSQEEAVAAMAEASQSLKEMSNGMQPQQQAAYQQAGQQLSGSGLTSDMADALKKPDLGQTADATEKMADKLNQLSEQQQQSLADQLDAAANQLQQSNPQMADQLHRAADALRRGDTQAAQQALGEAAQSARDQQQQNRDSPMAQAAQGAAQQMDQSQRELAQAGQQTTSQQSGQPQAAPESAQPSSMAGQQDQQSNQGQPSSQQNSQSQSGAGEEGQSTTGQQVGQPGEGQPQTQGEGQMTQQGTGSGQLQSQNQGQPGGSESAGTGSQTGESNGTAAQTSSGSPTSGSQSEQSGAFSAGTGQGGAGTDTTTGTAIDSGGDQISTNNAPQSGGLQDYNPVYNPSTIGGQADQTVDVGGQATGQEGQVIQEGEFGPNPAGESTLSYTGVYSSYQGIVSDALESGRIPLDQRDVIHDYFSSLER